MRVGIDAIGHRGPIGGHRAQSVLRPEQTHQRHPGAKQGNAGALRWVS
jgi:hypothetical protein